METAIPQNILASDPKPLGLDPLRILLRYLSTKQQQQHLQSNDENHSPQSASESADEVLQVVCGLFDSSTDSTSSSSIVEGAMQILDGSDSNITRVVSVASGRKMFLVRGSCSNNPFAKSKSLDEDTGTEISSHYFCLVPDSLFEIKPPSSSAHEHEDEVYYCSCPSFFTRNCEHVETTNAAEDTQKTGTTKHGTSPCKHLLALVLMPALGIQPAVLETSTDEDFSEFLLARIGS